MLPIFAFLAMLVLPATCFALLFTIEGNEPQAEANYTAWPKIVDVVNDASRSRLVWCNGDEFLYYKGKTADLNRLLEKFSKVEIDELRVVLRPQLKEPEKFDASLHVIGGVTKGVLTWKKEKESDLVPTLTIYLSENVQLKDLKVPENLAVDQVADLRKRYNEAQGESGYFGGALQQLENDAAREGDAGKKYAEDIQAIDQWVQNRKAAQKPAKP
jgi:hypothetical protein